MFKIRFKKKNKEDKELLREIKEEIKANIEHLKEIDGIEEKEEYKETIRNIKILNDVLKDVKVDSKGKIDWNMLVNTLIVSGVSFAQCAISWKEEPYKVFSSAAKMFIMKPKSKF